MPPRIVRDAPGGNHDATALDIPERQVLQGYPDDHFPYHQRILLICLGAARWLLATPTLDVYADNLEDEDLIPLERGAPFPVGNRPFFCFEILSAEVLRGLRARAIALASVLGVMNPTLASDDTDAVWVFADAAIKEFATPVPAPLLSGPNVALRASKGIVPVTVDGEVVDTFVERVIPDDMAEWIAEKRLGAGRDKRLTSLTVDDNAPVVLFREAVADMDQAATLHPLFAGGAFTTKEVVNSILASGLEPPAVTAAWETNSGVNPKSGLAFEHKVIMFTLWIMACRDRLDLFHSAAAEHLCRRLLQIERAVKKCPKAPEFAGLESVMEHVQDGTSSMVTPEFDKALAERQRTEAQFLKQDRLSREEAAHLETSRKAKAKAKGKGGKGGDAAVEQ